MTRDEGHTWARLIVPSAIGVWLKCNSCPRDKQFAW